MALHGHGAVEPWLHPMHTIRPLAAGPICFLRAASCASQADPALRRDGGTDIASHLSPTTDRTGGASPRRVPECWHTPVAIDGSERMLVPWREHKVLVDGV